MPKTRMALARLGAALGTAAHAAPTIGGCPVLPTNHILNARVDTLPVHAQSATWITSIGSGTGFHMDFGSGLYPATGPDAAPIGIPFVTVTGSQAKVKVDFTDYGDESDAAPGVPAPDSPPGSFNNYSAMYPLYAGMPIEGVGPATPSNSGGDRHTLVIDTTNCILYETGNTYIPGVLGANWAASGGAAYDLRSNYLRPQTWTSADAAGLPIFPLLVRYDEVAAGVIEHAIRFTASLTLNQFTWPARHQAGSNVATRPPMGVRFRLKAGVNINGFSAQARVIAQAMKTYGIILADNGSNWYVSGAPDSRWNNTALHELDVLRGSDFEAVDVSSLMINVNSAQVAGSCAAGDGDNDGIPDCIETVEGRNPGVKDNDIFNNNRLFAMQQYRDFLAREGDSGGVTFWTAAMNNGSQSRVTMVETFFNSAEFQGQVAPVVRMYFAYFLRIPDYGGLNYWIGQFKGGQSLIAISQQFAQSPEFQITYGSLNNSQFVDRVYRNVLGRAPDAGGLAFWTQQINSGMTRGEMMVQFSESAEYKATIDSEVFVTMMYVGMLRREPDPAGFNFWVGYKDSGQSGQALINGFLAAPEYHNRFLP